MPIVSQTNAHRSRYSFRQLALMVGAVLMVVAAANAAEFAIEVSHIAAGGGRSSSAGGCLAVDASIGQDILGQSSGGAFSLRAGFWPAVANRSDSLFNNAFEVCL